MRGQDFDATFRMIGIVGEELATMMAASFHDELVIPVDGARAEVGEHHINVH